VQAQDLVTVCARAERESQERQNKCSHHLGAVHGRCSSNLAANSAAIFSKGYPYCANRSFVAHVRHFTTAGCSMGAMRGESNQKKTILVLYGKYL
jgi:hypothetical protein